MDDWKLAIVERNHILRVMKVTNNRTRDAAAMLGIGTGTLYRKLHKYRKDAREAVLAGQQENKGVTHA